MSYIGTIPKDTFTTGLVDRFTSTTGTTVTLTHEISSKNDIIVFVNFVKQDSTNYSVGGTGNKTLTLGGTLVSSDIVEVHYLNKVFGTQQPSANSVGVTELNVSEGTSGQALTTNGSGTLSFSTISAGITEADTWRVNTNFNPSTGTQVINANWERDDTDGYGLLGSGMTESSGIFSFPSTGYYLVMFNILASHTSTNHYTTGAIQYTSNNSSYDAASETNFSLFADGSRYFSTGYTQKIFDITDISNHKIRFTTDIQASGVRIDGSSGSSHTNAIFIKLGNT